MCQIRLMLFEPISTHLTVAGLRALLLYEGMSATIRMWRHKLSLSDMPEACEPRNDTSRQRTHNLCHRSSTYLIDTVHTNGESDTSYFVIIWRNLWTIRHQKWTAKSWGIFSLEDTSQTSHESRSATDTKCCTPCRSTQATATKSSGATNSLHNGGHRTQSNKYTWEIGAS